MSDVFTGNIEREISNVWRDNLPDGFNRDYPFLKRPFFKLAFQYISKQANELVITASDVLTPDGDTVYIISHLAAYNQINKYLVDEACNAIGNDGKTNFWWDSENNWMAIVGKRNAINLHLTLHTKEN